MADIRSYIDELEPAIGRIRPALDRKALWKLFSTRSGASERGDYQGMIFFIAHSMGLFDNQVVVVGQFVDDKAPNGSPFWVSAPSGKSDYRLPENRKTRVKVFLNNDGLSHCSFERAVVGIARELSRVLLIMSGHRFREDEKAVDIVASEQLMPGENCGRHMPLVENVQGQCDQFLPVALGEKCDRPNQLCARARSSWRASGMAPSPTAACPFGGPA